MVNVKLDEITEIDTRLKESKEFWKVAKKTNITEIDTEITILAT